MNFIRNYILIIAFAIPTMPLVFTQTDSSITNILPEVSIRTDRIQYFADERSQVSISEKAIFQNGLFDIGDVLLTNSLVQINTNGGTGGSASVSIRGTESDHTNILWNGIRINSLTLGSADISAIPTDIANQIDVVYNGAASLYGSGTFGGAILLNNKADWKNKIKANYSVEGGSLQSHYHRITTNIGNQKIQYQLKAFLHRAENNFSYQDIFKSGKPILKQRHNALRNMGIVQNLFIRLRNNHKLEFGVWNQDKYKEIPNIMGAFGNSNKIQRDNTLKAYTKWQKKIGKSSISAQIAYVYDYLWYTDKANENDTDFLINSKIKTNRISIQADYRHRFHKYITADIGFSYKHNRADVINYGGLVSNNEGGLFIATKIQYQGLTTNASIRQDFHTLSITRPLLGIGFNYLIHKTKERVAISFSYADKYRVPDFNELYWIPGGNRNLKPEFGWGIDLGTSFIPFQSRNKKHLLKTDFTFYNLIINNNIIWVPDETGIWSPDNLKKIRSRGLESTLSYKMQIKTFSIQSLITYQYNRTIHLQNEITPNSIGKTLRYKPEHIFRSNLKLDHRYFALGINGAYTSAQFTDDSNTSLFTIEDYFLLHLFIEGKIAYKLLDTKLYFKINNLTNTSYQSIRSYAQPGRTYYIGVKIGINKSTKS